MRNRSQLAWTWIAAVCATTTGAWAQVIPSSPSFAAGTSLSAGTSPTSVVAGYFNNDTLADLAVTNQHGVSILINDGNGGFQPRVDYVLPTGSNPQWVATVHQKDGFLDDLAVANQGTGTVTFLTNNGDGTFQIGASYPAGSNPRMIVVDDFNGDHNLDLAVVDSGAAAPGTSGVSVLLGNGDGTYVTVNYNTQEQVMTVANPAAGGAVAPASSYRDANSAFTLSATGNPGYTFQNWTASQIPGNPVVGGTCGTAVCAQQVFAPVIWTANFTFIGQRCDLNTDAQLTVADVQTIIDQALGLSAPKADLDRDGAVTIRRYADSAKRGSWLRHLPAVI